MILLNDEILDINLLMHLRWFEHVILFLLDVYELLDINLILEYEY